MIKLLDNQTIHSTASDNLLSVMILNKDVHSIIKDEDDFIDRYQRYLYKDESENN